MTTRQFKLQKVLETRIHQQKETQMRLYENRGKQQQELRRLQELKERRKQIIERFRRELNRGTTGYNARMINLLSTEYNNGIKSVEDRIRNLKSEEKGIREELRRRTQEKKILEKLKERLEENIRIEAGHKEQKMLDELALKKIILTERMSP